MASLLERMSLPEPTASVGPVRNNKGNRSGGSSPYNRNTRPPKGDINSTWTHDLFSGPGAVEQDRSLSARLGNAPNAPKMNMTMADRALREAAGEKGLSIKGASGSGMGNVVQIGGLARGTTAEDVEAIFKRCGPITDKKVTSPSHAETVVVRLTYKNNKDAQAAVSKFNGQPADGRVLSVKVVGGVNASLGGRLGVAVVDGSVDVLMEDGPSKTGSKMRSDEILATDPRAAVLIAPPGTNPADYVQNSTRGRGGRGRGRGRGRRGGGAARMDVD